MADALPPENVAHPEGRGTSRSARHLVRRGCHQSQKISYLKTRTHLLNFLDSIGARLRGVLPGISGVGIVRALVGHFGIRRRRGELK